MTRWLLGAVAGGALWALVLLGAMPQGAARAAQRPPAPAPAAMAARGLNGPLGDTATVPCSAGCHEQRSEPRPAWHPPVGGQSSPTTSPAGATTTPTFLTVSPSAWVVADDPMAVKVTLKDAQGAPVARADVRFYVDARFIGTESEMEVGLATTDDQGVATFRYRPALPSEQQKITARFAGMGSYGASYDFVVVRLMGQVPSAYRPTPVELEAVGRWTLWAFLGALGGVWLAFAYILYQAYAIVRIGSQGPVV